MQILVILLLCVQTSCLALQNDEKTIAEKPAPAASLCSSVSKSPEEKLLEFQNIWKGEKREGLPGLLILPPSSSSINFPMIFINDGTQTYSVLRKSLSTPDESFILRLVIMAGEEKSTKASVHEVLHNKIVIFKPLLKFSCTYKGKTYPMADLLSFPTT